MQLWPEAYRLFIVGLAFYFSLHIIISRYLDFKLAPLVPRGYLSLQRRFGEVNLPVGRD
jgi:hypothetical protein